MTIEQLVFLFIYLFLGLGAWSTSKYRGDNANETPFICILVLIFWPVLLALYAIFFIFTGKKVCDE